MRHRTVWTSACATALVVGCQPGMEAVGVSTAGGGTPRADAGVAEERPPFDPALRASLGQITEGEATTGHAPGYYSYVLLANDAARAALDGGARSLPTGAVLGIEHRVRADGGAGPSFFMEKRGAGGGRFGGWRFVAVGPAGDVVDAGELESCGYCHRDAPSDYVFWPAP